MDKTIKELEESFPKERIMLVPMLLTLIDMKTWKFPEDVRMPKFEREMKIIEDCKELKMLFVEWSKIDRLIKEEI